MAYIQDISVLMRELLKVPKDYTPTALEISKYIKSRYSNDKESGKMLMGARAFSSGARGPIATPKTVSFKEPQPSWQTQAPSLHKSPQFAVKQRIAGRNFSFSAPRRSQEGGKPLKSTQESSKFERLNDTKVDQSRRSFSQQKYGWPGVGTPKKLKKPKTAPATVVSKPSPRQHQTFWSWQTAKNHLRRALSEMVVTPSSTPKTKLSALADQHKIDPKTETAIESKRKEMLKQMVDSTDLNEPLRTREIIQRLMEDNKLEAQRREIAKLAEMARTRLMESKKPTYSQKNEKRREAYSQ